MVDKNRVIEGLNHSNFIVANAFYEHVCDLHLYDDQDINKELIKFVKNNYDKINFAGLRFSKLNHDIIQCLVDIHANEKDEDLKESIDCVFSNHYSLIKDIDYDFEKNMVGEYDTLLYKKIKHFSNKNPDTLMSLYLENVKKYYYTYDATAVTEIIRMALGIALIQTQEGQNKLTNHIANIVMKNMDKNTMEIAAEIIYDHLPYLAYPLCRLGNKEYAILLLQLYLDNLDFIGYGDECNYYFSTICNEEFVKKYIKKLTKRKQGQFEDYYYDIAQYLNSEEVDNFLLEELRKKKNIKIKENIITILAKKLNVDVIPYALEHMKKGKFFDEEYFVDTLRPLLLAENMDDEISKGIIEKAEEYEEYYEKEAYRRQLFAAHKKRLNEESHIKEYKKARLLHQEIFNDMYTYFTEGKFKMNHEIPESINPTEITEKIIKFDPSTDAGATAMTDIFVYKNVPNTNCITEDFIAKNKYSNKEKVNMLHSMLNSVTGLFEVAKIDEAEGQVHLRNVLNDEQYCITDISFSLTEHSPQKYYLYMRLIKYNDITFGAGLVFTFYKNDERICKWIEENKNDFVPEKEFVRYMELYEMFVQSEDKPQVKPNTDF